MRRSLARVFCVVFTLVLCFGCAASHDYLGDRYPPTESVRVFYPHEAVPDGYAVMGTNRTEASERTPAEEMVAAIVEKAKAVGADAVSVDEFSIEFAGATRTTDVDRDEYGYTEQTRVSDRRVKVIRSVFLKRERG